MIDGRFSNAAGFLGIRAISEFDAIHRIRVGDVADVERRFDRAAAARRNVVRVFMMARNLFDLSPSQQGYWEAAAKCVELAAARGLYVEPCLFPDAQHVLPDAGDRRALVQRFAAFCREHVSVIPQLANEPSFNGFSGATDPALLDLAEAFAAAYGSRDFSIGDPPDVVESESGGEPLGGFLEVLAGRSNILVLHGDRAEDPGRFGRWIDHLKGFTDFRSRSALRGRALWHDEPMGVAGMRDVPIVGGRMYRREHRAEALVAAACCSAIFQIGFTTHYISAQNDTIPGLEESAIAADIPQGPDWRFINAAIAGSPVVGFSGFEKVRPSTNGRDAWACAYGHQKGSIEWAPGFQPVRVFNGNNVEVWRAMR